MTNAQAQAYAVIALWRMLRNEHVTGEKGSTASLKEIDEEMHWLFDTLTEDEAEAKAASILSGRL